MATKNKTQDTAEVSKEAPQVKGEAAAEQSAKSELAELETAYQVKRKELRTVVREEGKSAIVELGRELANDLYTNLVMLATDSGQKINRFTIRLGKDGKAIIKSAIVRLPKTADEKKTEADKKAEAATAKTSGK